MYLRFRRFKARPSTKNSAYAELYAAIHEQSPLDPVENPRTFRIQVSLVESRRINKRPTQISIAVVGNLPAGEVGLSAMRTKLRLLGLDDSLAETMMRRIERVNDSSACANDL